MVLSEVLASVPPEVSRYLSINDKARLQRKGAVVAATLQGIVPALDTESRTVRLRLVPDEPTAWLLPGAAVDVLLTIERSEDEDGSIRYSYVSVRIDSDAHTDSSLPVDNEMGVGQLNARRALTQYLPGEPDPGSFDVG